MATHLDFPELIATADRLFGINNYLRFAIAPEKFADAIQEEGTLWITNSEGFGIAFGPQANALASWERFTLPRNAPAPDQAHIRGTWDFFARSLNLRETKAELPERASDVQIANFLEAHSPDASVKPGDPEIQLWTTLLDQSGEISAAGAIVKWQSGELCLASIATHTAQRGNGLAAALVTTMVERCEELGAKQVGLGVYAENYSAKRVYTKCGFTLMNEFTSYSRD